VVAFLLLFLTTAHAAESCPPVPYPAGIDAGAAVVEATLVIDAQGGVADATRWSGPEALVAAVEGTLGACRFASGPTIVDHAWTFTLPPVNVAGVVRARGTRDAVPHVTVAVADRSTLTEDDGSFAFRNVAPGMLHLRVVDADWHLPPTPVELAEGERVDVTLWVAPEGERDELVATYTPLDAVGVVRTVNVEASKGIPGTLGDPLRALAGQPGLARTPYDSGWLLVRGGDFDETGTYLDGVRTPLVYHLGGFTSVLHPEMIEEVRFYPGLFPARYGNAISGAVDLVPGAVGERPHVVGGMNSVFAHAFVEVPTKVGGFAAAARRSYLDGVLALIYEPESADIAPRFWDAQARATIGKGSIMVIGSADAIDAPAFTGEGTLEITQDAFQAQAMVPLGSAWAFRPWFAWSRRHVEGDVTPQTVQETYPGFRLEGRTAPAAPVRATTGLEVQRRAFHLERGTATRDAPLWTFEPYAGARAGDVVSAWGEIRLLSVVVEGDPSQPARAGLSPRAGMAIAPIEPLAIHASYGRLHQLPPPTILLGLPEGVYLDLEHSDQVTGGLQLAGRGAAFDADIWRRTSGPLAEFELDGSVGTAEGRAWGVDAQARIRRAGFDGSILYQYTRSEKREDPDNPWGPSPFETPHRIELLAIQSLPRNWSVSARFRAVSGYPRLPDSEGTLQPTEAYDLLKGTLVQLDDLDPDDERLDPFHALDLRVARTFSFRTWELDVSLDVQNVYDARTVEPVITGFGESRPSYGFGLPTLPILSIEGNFWPGRQSD
jgi:hypothetical protein